MENSALELFREAVYEENQSIRLSKLSRACKKVSDLLPFDRKCLPILEERDLIRFMMLAYPLFTKSIDLIMRGLVDKFQDVDLFIEHFCTSLDYIATLPERNLTPDSTRRSINSFSMRDNTFLKYDYCQDLILRKYKVKLYALDFAERIIDIIESETPRKTEKFDYVEFFKNMLNQTGSDKVIVKCCMILNNVRKKHPFEFRKAKKFDAEIEDILLRKHRKKGAMDSFHSSEQESSDDELSKIEMLKSSSLKSLKTGKLNEEDLSDKDSEIYGEKEQTNSLIVQLEDWMVSEDPPLIGKNDFIGEFFKLKENFIRFFSFVLEPCFFSCTPKWAKKYSMVILGSREENERFFRNHPRFRAHRHLSFFPKNIASLNMRSYMTMKILTEVRNFRHMLSCYSHMIELFFQNLYSTLKKEEELLFNMNHIIAVLEFFLRKDPETSVSYLIHYNILFRLIYYFDVPLVYKFFLDLLIYPEKNPMLPEKFQIRIWKYTHFSELIKDICDLMLNVRFDPYSYQKGDISFKTANIMDLIHFSEKNDQTKVLALSKTEYEPVNKFPLFEEYTGWATDVDRLEELVMMRKRQVRNRFMSIIQKSKINPIMKKESDPTLVKESPKIKKKNLMIATSKLLVTQKYETAEESLEEPYWMIYERNKKQIKKEAVEKILHIPQNEKKNVNKVPSKPEINSLDLSSKVLNTNSTNDDDSALKGVRNSKKPPSITKASVNNVMKKELTSEKLSKTLNEGDPSLASKNFHKKSKENISNKSQTMTPNKLDITLPRIKENESNEQSLLNGSRRNFKNEADKKFSDTIKKIEEKKKTNILPQSGYLTLSKKEDDNLLVSSFSERRRNEVYPFSFLNTIETEVDIFAKSPDFHEYRVMEDDDFSLIYAELIFNLWRTVLENVETNPLKDLIKIGTYNYWLLTEALLRGHETECFSFDRLMKNYLIKFFLNKTREQTSSLVCGENVNLILSNLSTKNLKKYKKTILNICYQHFYYMMRVLQNSYTWEETEKKDIKISGPFIVRNPLGTARLTLVRTLYLILLNNGDQKYNLLEEMGQSIWHQLSIWFFKKRNNDSYQRLFLKIMDLALTNGSTKLIMSLFFQLNLVNSISSVLFDIYPNNVLKREENVDAFFYNIKNLVRLIIVKVQNEPKHSFITSQLQLLNNWAKILKILKPQNNENPDFLSPRKSPSLVANQSIYQGSKRSLLAVKSSEDDFFQRSLNRNKTFTPIESPSKSHTELGNVSQMSSNNNIPMKLV